MQRDKSSSVQPLRKEDLAMGAAAFAYRESIDRQIEEIEKDPDAPDFSPEAAERLHSKVMEQFAKRRRKKARQKAARRILQVAACLLILCVAVSFTVLQVDAARIATANYIIQTFPQYAEIRYDAQMNALPPIGWAFPYYPTWLPEGTRVVRLQIEDSTNYYIGYMKKNGSEFHFAVFPADKQSGLYGCDAENMLPKEISINGRAASLSYDEERNIRTLIFSTTDHVIMLRGVLSKDEIIKIAENINLP